MTERLTDVWIPVSILDRTEIDRRWYITLAEDEKIIEAREWCKRNYGMEALYSGNWDHHRWWHSTNRIEVFWFKEERDAALFLLRWS